MLSLFLKAKHWQLFLITFALPVLAVLALVINIYTTHESERPDAFVVMVALSSMPVLVIILLIAIFGWQWAVVIGLQKKIPAEAKFGLTRFKILFFIPIIYTMIFTTLVSMIIIAVFTEIAGAEGPDAISLTGLTGLIFVTAFLHLFSIFCVFHSLYFAAKTIKTVELQRRVSFLEFIDEFLLIWFYPIGIWFLQPKINEWMRKS